ncbi:Uma2 family endonuclease [Streptacidiphilus carbonis]|jgi:Uma2 family endonuclease|uniref:Uma2 family endonuclease n=1 Tax=Streptacidiphilus carbonis TaxID=105422 RepID=UPI0005AB6A91|nr:Uma2 family endonuclease [Streptacidiphilus carbonis]
MDPQHFALLEEARRALPQGFKAEISGDIIVMMVSPSGIHQRNLLIVRRQFDANAPAELLPSENTDLISPQVGKSRNPDLTYLPEQVLETTDNQVPAETAAIAVELVSPSNPENDWVGKVRDYPLMGIPLYLLIDARQKTVTLFSRPDGTKYHRREDIEFGEGIRIPEPFDFELDTSGLLPYG